MPKKIITERVMDLATDYFERTLSELQDQVDEWIKTYGKDAKLSWDPYRHFAYDTNPSPTFYIVIDREETTEECAKREGDLAARVATQQARELAEFNRLSVKFGKK